MKIPLKKIEMANLLDLSRFMQLYLVKSLNVLCFFVTTKLYYTLLLRPLLLMHFTFFHFVLLNFTNTFLEGSFQSPGIKIFLRF